jgi:hypothetical protein
VVAGLVSIGLVYGVTARAGQRRVDSRMDDLRASNIAEAAVAEAMTALSMSASGNIATPGQPAYLDQGVLWVQSTPVVGEMYRLQAVAMHGSGRAALDVHVERLPEDPLFYAVLNSREQLTLNADVTIDSFDSKAGSYASQAVNTTNGRTHANTEGDVASNQGIVLNANAMVLGDAIPGPGYGVSFATGSHVSGSTNPAAAPFAFPPIVTPNVPKTGSLSVNPGSSLFLPSGSHGLTNLSIGKNATLTVQGPAELVLDDFSGGKDATLEIDATNGPVTIYVAGSYTHYNGFEAVPISGSPMALAFMIEGTQDLIFPSASKIRGAYYAPKANITFTSNNEAWGAFAGNRVDMSSTMSFHYDESLADYWNNSSGGSAIPVAVRSWMPAEVPAALRSDRRDPFQLLGLAPTALKSPADSWL